MESKEETGQSNQPHKTESSQGECSVDSKSSKYESETRAELVSVSTDKAGQVAPLMYEYLRFYKQNDKSVKECQEFLMSLLATHRCTIFAAQVQSAFVGFVLLYPLYSSLRLAKSFILNDLYVLPSFRSKGIAKRLLEKAIAYARESGGVSIELATAPDNTPAQSLYIKHGFQIDSFLHYELNLQP